MIIKSLVCKGGNASIILPLGAFYVNAMLQVETCFLTDFCTLIGLIMWLSSLGRSWSVDQDRYVIILFLKPTIVEFLIVFNLFLTKLVL